MLHIGLMVLALSASGAPSDAASEPPVSPVSHTTGQPDRVISTQAGAPAIQNRDRVLFVGDEMTQQMFYTRAIASALLAVMPEAHLRFFNGGREGATVQDAGNWVEDLLELAQPTVVFVCFGLNDAQRNERAHIVARDFRASLSSLIQQIRAAPTVRLIVILGPPAVSPTSPGEMIQPADNRMDEAHSGYNQTLKALSTAAKQAADAAGAPYIDLFDHTLMAYKQVLKVGGKPLTIAGRLPSEPGHIIIASSILRGLGVSVTQLDPIGWSPLRPVEMGRIRGALALRLTAPTLKLAQRSRNLYESMRPFDEQFFRLWRLTQRRPKMRQTLRVQADQAWVQVQQWADQYRSPSE